LSSWSDHYTCNLLVAVVLGRLSELGYT